VQEIATCSIALAFSLAIWIGEVEKDRKMRWRKMELIEGMDHVIEGRSEERIMVDRFWGKGSGFMAEIESSF
jgi:hypothetical protein